MTKSPYHYSLQPMLETCETIFTHATLNPSAVSVSSTDFLTAILELEHACFPESWQYPDSEQFFCRALVDPLNINVCLINDQEIVGYALARPLNAIIQDLLACDGELIPDCMTMYLETIQVHPSFQRNGGGRSLLNKTILECSKRDYSFLAMHARCLNNFNLMVRNYHSDRIVKTRKIASWPFGGAEQYEYIELMLRGLEPSSAVFQSTRKVK